MMRVVTLGAPDEREVHLAGGILGLEEEAPRTTAFLEANPVDRILLGIPFEDLDAIRAAPDEPKMDDFERDDVDEVYLNALARYGPTRVPPGDLYAAFAFARANEVPVEAIDLGDEGHSSTWAAHVGIFELVRNNRRLRHMDRVEFQAETPEAFAREWDEAIFPTKGLKKVQADREAWMSGRIREIARAHRRLFALVPLARVDGVQKRLVDEGGFHVRTAHPKR